MNRTKIRTENTTIELPEHLLSVDDFDKYRHAIRLVDGFCDKVGFYCILKDMLSESPNLFAPRTIRYLNPLEIYTEDYIEFFSVANELVKFDIAERIQGFAGKTTFSVNELSYLIHRLFGDEPLKERRWYEFESIDCNNQSTKVMIPEHFTFDEICEQFNGGDKFVEILTVYQRLNYTLRNWQAARFMIRVKEITDTGAAYDLSCRVEKYLGRDVWTSDYYGITDPFEAEMEPATHGWIINKCFSLLSNHQIIDRWNIDALPDDRPVLTAGNWESFAGWLLGNDWLEQYKTRSIMESIMSRPMDPQLFEN